MSKTGVTLLILGIALTRANPLTLGKHYVVRKTAKCTHVDGTHMGWLVAVDRSGRLWSEENFRPLKFDPVLAGEVAYPKRAVPVKGARLWIGPADPSNTDDWVEIKKWE